MTSEAIPTDEALAIVGEYADRVWRTTDEQEADTIAVGEAMEALYESRVWVDEWLEQKPRPTSRYAMNFKADSRNRFAQWQAWKLEELGHKPVTGTHTYRLLDGVRVLREIPNFTRGEIRSERTLRPLKWLLKTQRPERIPEVWKRAIDEAGSESAVTGDIVRAALNGWKRDVLGTAGTKAALGTARVVIQHRRAIEAVAKYRETWATSDSDETEWNSFISDLRAILEEADRAVA